MKVHNTFRIALPAAASAALVLGLATSPVLADDIRTGAQFAEQTTDSDSGRMLVQYEPEAGTDEAITSEVQEVLNTDPAIREADIEVRAEAGVVYLEGEVPDEQVLSRAIELASTVMGVRHVDSSGLKIKA
ncbi:MAG TPA: BON domain-containing protein [Xanthomonadaceae bacterium]|nr:BON domain-containing protein [Xanthomonadaceae bacterium]